MATFTGWKCRLCGKTVTTKDGVPPPRISGASGDSCGKSPDKKHIYEKR